MAENGTNGRSTLLRKLGQRLLVMSEPYLYVERTDEAGNPTVPRGLHAVGLRVNQAVIEAGKTPPWVMTDEQCRAFWASRVAGGPDNDPVDMARKDPSVMDFLHSFWQPEVDFEDEILELGPNAGGNLAALRKLGYRHLSGVEINTNALEVFRREHPETWEAVTIVEGSFEGTLPTLAARSYDCVFTASVGIHIHPASHRVFSEMVRLSRKHVAILETEAANGRYTFARNYKRVFERLGCTQIRELHVDPTSVPNIQRQYDGYVARLFRVGDR
jgi:SAM-dependent methyltransferase